MNWIILIPFLIQIVEQAYKGLKKGKVKKQKVIDLFLSAVASQQIKLPEGLSLDMLRPVLSLMVDMAVSIYNDSGMFSKNPKSGKVGK